MNRTPMEIANIKAGDHEFLVHKELLTRDSKYFQAALDGGFLEAKSQRIELQDVLPADLGFYIDILYRHFFNKDFILRKEHTGGSLSTKQILAFWQIADRFINEPLTMLAMDSLNHRLSLYSEFQWKKLYEKRSKEDLEGRMQRLQDAYNQCVDNGIPFEDHIVSAAANAPVQVYCDTAELMEPDFMALVSKKMMMRHADLTLTKKRPAPSTSENGASRVAGNTL